MAGIHGRRDRPGHRAALLVRDRTYLGGEFQYVVSVLPIGIRIGAFKPTTDTPGAKKTLWLADLSLMY